MLSGPFHISSQVIKIVAICSVAFHIFSQVMKVVAICNFACRIIRNAEEENVREKTNICVVACTSAHT